jgi:Carbohydrate esterase 2 N-terminal
MRFSVFAAIVAATVSTACVIAACSSDPADGGGGTDPDAAGAEGGPNVDGSNDDGATGQDAGRDAAKKDGDTETDGAIPDDGGKLDGGDPPSVQLIGRFENDGVGDKFAFPGSKVVVRFKGSDAVMKLTQTDGFSVGHTWFNVAVDGVAQTKLEVSGASVDYPVATNLDPMLAHTVEIEKRTEPTLGVVRLESVTFPNGGVLLGPPVRPSRRIEFLSDSTIDGFGIEGSRLITAPAALYCGDPASPATNYGALPQFNNARKSMAGVTAASLSAEQYLIAYSGKGLTKNNDPGDTLLFSMLYDRALPDRAASAWGFGWIPDAVVVSLGGVDFDDAPVVGGFGMEPAGFTAAYGALVDKIRLKYPAAWIFLTVWSQIKDQADPKIRTPMRTVLQNVIAARADAKISFFQFPEAVGGDGAGSDETGCEYHGTEAHHAAMAALLVTELKAKLGW